jgi:hypothetical protein
VLLLKFLAEKLFSAGINAKWSARKVRTQSVHKRRSAMSSTMPNPKIRKRDVLGAREFFDDEVLAMMSESVLPMLARSSYHGN